MNKASPYNYIKKFRNSIISSYIIYLTKKIEMHPSKSIIPSIKAKYT